MENINQEKMFSLMVSSALKDYLLETHGQTILLIL